MKYLSKIYLIFLTAAILCQTGKAQTLNPYIHVNRLCGEYAQKYTGFTGIQATPLCETLNGEKSWLFTISLAKNPNTQPALVIIAGVDVKYAYTSHLALQCIDRWASQIKSGALVDMLKKYTIYVLPNASVDALSKLKNINSNKADVNSIPNDADKDGKVDEDPYNDLDSDGKITTLRIQHPAGQWTTHPDDPRVLIPIDLTKLPNSSSPTYKIFSEGFDDDGDLLINEDIEGGTTFNKNFTYQYPFFQPNAGREPIGEIETQAIAQFLFNTSNINVVFVLGPHNNLSKPAEFNESKSNAPVPTMPKENDAKVYALLSKMYLNEVESAKEKKNIHSDAGALLPWAYYHYGRFAVGSPAWFIPKLSYKNDSTLSTTDNQKNKARCESDNDLVRYLYWSSKNSGLNPHTDWKRYDAEKAFKDKPANTLFLDYPNSIIEIGGIDSLILFAPPVTALDSLVEQHSYYFTQVTKILPAIEIQQFSTEKIGDKTYRINLEVMNTGYLPTQTQIGQNFTYCPQIVVDITANAEVEFLSGLRHNIITPLDAKTSKKMTWVVKGKGQISLKAGAPNTGFATQSISLD